MDHNPVGYVLHIQDREYIAKKASYCCTGCTFAVGIRNDGYRTHCIGTETLDDMHCGEFHRGIIYAAHNDAAKVYEVTKKLRNA